MISRTHGIFLWSILEAINGQMPSEVGFAVAGIAKQFARYLMALELP